MIKIYHVAGTRGLRAIWTCEELSIPYEVEVVNFDPEYRASPEWRSINPVGKVPAMSDGDLVMFESGAMVQYWLIDMVMENYNLKSAQRITLSIFNGLGSQRQLSLGPWVKSSITDENFLVINRYQKWLKK